jgi:hypothetical protein
MTLAPNAASAQFPPPPPMASPPPIAAGGPPPLPAGDPSAFAGGPPMGLGGEPRADFGGPAPRPGAGPGPRGSLGALSVRAGGRGGPAIARSDQARSASVSYRRSGSISHGYGGRLMVQPTPLEHMQAMAMAARTMAIIPTATATTPTVVTDAFWLATSGRDGLQPANTAVDIISALASLVLGTQTGSLTAVARRRRGPCRCVSVSSWLGTVSKQPLAPNSVSERGG